MPTYGYRCPKCERDFDKRASMSDAGLPQPCPECGEMSERSVTPVGFILAGDNWPSKVGRIKGQMAEKNKRLDVKSNERKKDAPGMWLAPNVEGERTDSWADAQKLAASKGKDTKSYEPMIQKEKRGEK